MKNDEEGLRPGPRPLNLFSQQKGFASTSYQKTTFFQTHFYADQMCVINGNNKID
jgi:hypothetical protein